MNSKILFKAAAALFFLTWLPGCVLRDISPQYALLHAQAETDPHPDAIVGMWHKQGGPRAPESKTSVLFRRDGTGMEKEFRVYPDRPRVDVPPVTFTYRYKGNGLWMDSGGDKYWLSSGFLLREGEHHIIGYTYEGMHGPGMTKHVFERVE
jgi:hypothetical protein